MRFKPSPTKIVRIKKSSGQIIEVKMNRAQRRRLGIRNKK